MPNNQGKGYKGSSHKADTPFSELDSKEQLRRAKSAKETATGNIKAARKSKDKGGVASATKAWEAANRVINRLDGASNSTKGPAPAKSKGSTPAERREPFEKGTGTDKIKKKLEGVANLADTQKKKKK